MNNLVELKKYVPPFLIDRIFQTVYNSMAEDLYNFDRDLEDAAKQAFPQTATWGLPYWEEFCGVDSCDSKDFEVRRAEVISKLSKISPITIERLKSIVSPFCNSGKDLDIVQYPSQYKFRMIFSDIDKISDFQSIVKTIKEAKPAHLALDFNLGMGMNTFNTSAIANTYRIFISFWNYRYLDGSWFLDGAAVLNGLQENIEFNPLRIRNAMKFSSIEEMQYTVTTQYNLWYLNGEVTFDEGRALNADIKEEVL